MQNEGEVLQVLQILSQPTQVLVLVLLKGVLVTAPQSGMQVLSCGLRNKELEHETQLVVLVWQVAQLLLQASHLLPTSLVIVVSWGQLDRHTPRWK